MFLRDSMAKILVTGSKGFIGRRLVYGFLKEGHQVFALTRKKSQDNRFRDFNNFNEIIGDMTKEGFIEALPHDIDAAYYFLHSLATFNQDLTNQEKKVAKNFLNAIEKTTCKQIIYLAGIVEHQEELSDHLKSRHAVEEVLKNSQIPLTVLRSSIVIGSSSASFEIMRDLCEKLPFMIAPKWVRSYCQPIAICDVLYYLKQALLNPKCFNKTYDIAGPEAVTFEELLMRYSKFRGLKRKILNVPALTPRLSSYWLYFITNINFSICRYLVDSMKHSTRKFNNLIDDDIPRKTLTIEESLKLIFQSLDQNEAVSFYDKVLTGKEFIDPHFVSAPRRGVFNYKYKAPFKGSVDTLFQSILSNTKSIVKDGSLELLFSDPERKKILFKYNLVGKPYEKWLTFKIDQINKVLSLKLTLRPIGLKGRMYGFFWKPILNLNIKKILNFFVHLV
jgi:uncharacterized protein YbjT (DUF2867 family)